MSKLSLVRRVRLSEKPKKSRKPKQRPRSRKLNGLDRLIYEICTRCRYCLGNRKIRTRSVRIKVDCARCQNTGLDPEPLDFEQRRAEILGPRG